MKKANDADLRTFYSNSLSIVACGKYVIKKIEMYKLNFQLYAGMQNEISMVIWPKSGDQKDPV